jgi:uncharacterized membrane protein YfcA
VYLFLFAAALAGGALNAVAGGGSFIGLPALLSAGVAPVAANATTTFAMWPGSVSSVLAYRREVMAARGSVVGLGITSLIGGVLGGWLLLKTSDARFLRLLPWLMLAAAVIFTFGGRLTARLRRGSAGGPGTTAMGLPIWIFVFQLVIAAYGGYFGGGMGIMMLAAFAVAGMTNMHEMNGLKALLAVAINGVALVEFVAGGAIAWAPGLVMAGGGIVGGYAGAALARRVEPSRIRLLAIAVAWIMTIYFFLR